MYLDAVETGAAAATEFVAEGRRQSIYEPWTDWPPTEISHHGEMCCDTAREWIAAYDLSMLSGGSPASGPRWLRQRFDWGPSVYPIHWCEALTKDSIDCGVHAALAYEVFAARGVECFRVQMVQEFDAASLAHWQTKWHRSFARTDWMHNGLIYHEGCAIETGPGRIKIWDPSAGWWLDPKFVRSYGSLRALKLTAETIPHEIAWGDHLIAANVWRELA